MWNPRQVDVGPTAKVVLVVGAICLLVTIGLVFAARGDFLAPIGAASAAVVLLVNALFGPEWRSPRRAYVLPAFMFVAGVLTALVAEHRSSFMGFGVALAVTAPFSALQIKWRRNLNDTEGE